MTRYNILIGQHCTNWGDYYIKLNHLIGFHAFQESPTGELADYSFSTEVEASGEETSETKNFDQQPQPDPELEAQSHESPCVSKQTDGNKSEEGEDVICCKE